MEQMNLDDILSGKDSPAPTPESAATPAPTEAPATPAATAAPEATPQPKDTQSSSFRKAHQVKEQAAQGRARDPETGQFVEKEEEKVAAKPATDKTAAPAAPKEEMTDKERAFMAAAKDEREKRQRLEAEIAIMRASTQSNAASQQPQQQPVVTKTFWDDPEAYLKGIEQNIQGVTLKVRLDTSEQIARSRYPDFQEKMGVFGEIVKANPAVGAQLIQAPDPAEFAYKLAKNQQELQQVGNLDALREKIEKETRIKLEAEFKQREEAKQTERAALPGSLSNVTGVGGNSGKPVWGGPPSLDNILKS